jgi:hypothetical protein
MKYEYSWECIRLGGFATQTVQEGGGSTTDGLCVARGRESAFCQAGPWEEGSRKVQTHMLAVATDHDLTAEKLEATWLNPWPELGPYFVIFYLYYNAPIKIILVPLVKCPPLRVSNHYVPRKYTQESTSIKIKATKTHIHPPSHPAASRIRARTTQQSGRVRFQSLTLGVRVTRKVRVG